MSSSPLIYLSTLQHGNALGNIWSDTGKGSSTCSFQELPWSMKGLDLLAREKYIPCKIFPVLTTVEKQHSCGLRLL